MFAGLSLAGGLRSRLLLRTAGYRIQLPSVAGSVLRRAGLGSRTLSLAHSLNDSFSARITPSGEIVVDSPQKSSRLHNLWLRDHCRCSGCFHSITKQRLFDTFKLESVPSKVEANSDGLSVTWTEKHADNTEHVSVYPWDFLSQAYAAAEKPSGTLENSLIPHGKVPWTSSEISQTPPSVDYEAVMNDESSVQEWLENVHKHGFSFVNGVPATPEATEELIRRIAFIRITQYDGFWDFTADLAHGDTAYTNLALGAHTDNTYFTDPCGLQIFHMLSHTEGSGGESLLVDGFRAAEQLRIENPVHFDTLVSTRVPAHAVGDPKYHFVIPQSRGNPIVSVDGEGKLARIAYNNDDRSTIRGKSPEELDEWYATLKHWNQVLTSKEAEYWVKLQPGTVVVIDNHRVLHGRSAFTGKRRMCGAYIGSDDYLARLRALAMRGRDSHHWSL